MCDMVTILPCSLLFTRRQPRDTGNFFFYFHPQVSDV